jgi:anthranilate phosphoribosyltransferase
VILRGEASPPQIAAFLAALRVKGETAGEILGLAQAMRDSCLRVDPGPVEGPLVDTCGTGGDGLATLNISTLAAFVVASCGLKVAKHGNRSFSSQCGSADLLEALGARVDLTPEAIGRCIRETGIGFLFAPVLHPAMKYAAEARRAMGTRTAFNLLGPLTNPAGANVQVVGAPSLQAAELLAVTLASLGLHRGFVVSGAGGLDEVATTGPSDLYGLTGGAIDHQVVQPEDFGVQRASIGELRGGDPYVNASLARAVLNAERGPRRDVVVVNAAVALVAAGHSSGFRAGAQAAADAIDSGAAARLLDRFIEFTCSAA